MVKNPRIGGAVLGAGAGLVGNTCLVLIMHWGITLAGAGFRTLGSRGSLLAGSLKKSPLLGKNFAAGAKANYLQ